MCPDTSDARTRTLDARETAGEPFGNITSALDTLSEDETLVLINRFEPEPLYDVLERRGFEYETVRVDGDEWRVSITRA